MKRWKHSGGNVLCDQCGPGKFSEHLLPISNQSQFNDNKIKWDFEAVRSSLNVSARVTKSSVYFCVYLR